MNSVAIVGVGLIGGSFARALRKAGFRGRLCGVSSPATLERAIAAGLIDDALTLQEASACDLILLAQPISQILATVPKLSGAQGWVTDAGSTKRAICRAAESIPRFVGGHPMAGKEHRGLEHADADLFRDRPWLLTSEPPPFLREWLERIGARIRLTTPEEHDRMVARASHLPQLLSNAIAAATVEAKAFGGPGLDSMTRLSGSSFDIWRDILSTNRDEIAAAMDEFGRQWEERQRALREGDDTRLFR